jgi:hypothetical protein
MKTWLLRLAGLLLVLAFGMLVFARAMDRDLNHDEHQFLAPAALLAREGVQPWRDYPLFHLPNLVFAYAAADRLTGNLLLGAKLLGVLATVAAAALLVAVALRKATAGTLLAAALGLALLLADPLFRYTAGKTWNHEIPTALLLAALVLLARAAERDRLWLTALAGVCGGLAAGCRLTFAPTLAGLFLFTLLLPLAGRRRLLHAATLTAAATLALAPSFYYALTHAEAFVFGNFEFPRLRLTDPTNERIQKTISWWRKLRFFAKEVVLPSWPVFALWLLVGPRAGWAWFRSKEPSRLLAAMVLLIFPFLLFGCFAPSRYQYQHFFAFIPLLLLGLLSSPTIVPRLWPGSSLAVLGLALAGLAVQFSATRQDYAEPLANLTQPGEWFPARVTRLGAEIRQHAPDGRILTLAPAYPLQAGLRIYPELATGAFAWRSAHLVPPERRARLHLIAPEDLADFLRREPPAAILTGVEEDEEEAPLIAWAEAHGYHRIALKKKRGLWLPRLGANHDIAPSIAHYGTSRNSPCELGGER